ITRNALKPSPFGTSPVPKYLRDRFCYAAAIADSSNFEQFVQGSDNPKRPSIGVRDLPPTVRELADPPYRNCPRTACVEPEGSVDVEVVARVAGPGPYRDVSVEGPFKSADSR